jgi:hypothetical protein
MAILMITTHPNQNELAASIQHEGIRVGEIIAYRAWRAVAPGWLHRRHDRLHSILISHYVWDPDEPASGDIREHGIYSFRNVIKSISEYGYDAGRYGPILFGKIKIWGEIVEHEAGYRSEFAKIVSLDYGDLELLAKFRQIYKLNQDHLPHQALLRLAGGFPELPYR